MYENEYRPPTLTVDGVIFQLQNNALCVLLIQRAAEPFKGCWALPGGYCSAGETTSAAIDRILQKKAGIQIEKLGFFEQLYTFDTVSRDPRGHAVSVTYFGLGKDSLLASSDTTQTPTFFPVSTLPELAYDHADIIAYAHTRLKAKISYTNTIRASLPPQFTLFELQASYESILGVALDKRNFRKKFLSLGLITATDDVRQEGAHRPARLYTFTHQYPQILTRSFE